MKKLLFILMSFSLIACGGGEDAEGEAGESAAAYYIKLGSEGEETNNDHDINYFSDNIAQETQFDLKGMVLKINGMTGDFGNDPNSIVGKEYDGTVDHGSEPTACKVSFTKVTEVGSDDMKTDYDLEGTIKTDTEEGSFKVTMFKMNH